MDPVFGFPVTESYVVFCQGRDAKECSLLVSGSAGEPGRTMEVSVEAAPAEKKEYALMPESGNIHWLARKMAVRNSSFQSIPLDRLNRVMNSLEFTILSVLKDRSALEGAENRLYVKDISQWLNVPAARLSPIFTKLEEEGYIRWESDERLGASYVALTDYGKKKLEEQKAEVEEIKKTPKKTYAPLLYDLTELQREANQRFGYSAKETLNIMQRLYENHKVLTYPRTDSRYLSKDIVPTIKDRLEACGTGPYRKLAMTAKKKDLSGKLAFVNDAKVSDHHAIIPTEQFVDLSHMTNEERKIYDLVVRRFLAVLYPPFEYEQTQVTVKVGGETFLASGKIVKAQGWRAAYEEEVYSAEDEEEEEAYESGKSLKGQTLPELEKGQEFKGLVLSF